MADDTRTHFPSLRTGRSETPWEYRALIWNFTRTDLRSRFKGTALGWLWSLVVPLFTLATYSLVFSVFIRVPPPPFGNGDPGNYAIWLVTGLVTWQFLAQIITRGMPAILNTGTLLRKVYFPSFVPVVAASISVAVQSAIELLLVLTVLLVVGNVGATWLLMPIWIVVMWAFTTALGYIIGVANVRWRDLAQIVGVVLQLLFFLSAVIFPITMVPDQVGPIPARMLIEFNPLAQFVLIGRDLMYALQLPDLKAVAYVVAVTGVTVVAARWLFTRHGRDVGEAL